MYKKLISILLLCVLIAPLAFAEEVPKKYDEDVPFGQSINVNFGGFGQYDVQVREGSAIFFNAANVKNTFIVDKIDENAVTGRLSIVSGQFKEYELPFGLDQEQQIDLTDKLPFLLMHYRMHTPSDDVTERAAVIRIRMPFVTSASQMDGNNVGTELVDESYFKEDDSEDPFTKWLVVLVIVLLLVVIGLGPKMLKKKKSKK
jgi:hypothetical protein